MFRRAWGLPAAGIWPRVAWLREDGLTAALLCCHPLTGSCTCLLVGPTCRYLYDSPLESQLTQVFDANKRLLYTGDAVPEDVSLVKGEHTARVMLRHDNMALLEKLKNTCLVSSAATAGQHSAAAVAVLPACVFVIVGSDCGELYGWCWYEQRRQQH